MSDQDMNAALDALEEEHGVINDPIDEQAAVDPIDEPLDDPIDDQKPEDVNPPGYIDNLDDWVASGKNPDDFKGKNAYSAEFERIKELRELKDSMKTMADGVNDWKKQQELNTKNQVERARREVVAELEKAKDESDIDGALAAQDKLNNIDSRTAPVVERNPVITEFFAKNPIVDSGSSQYDPEFFDDMAMAQQTILNQLTGGDEQLAESLTPAQIKRSMNVAYSRTKELHPDKFASQRNSRRAAPTPSRRATPTGADSATRLKNAGIKSKHNARDNNAANEIYEMIKASDPKAAEIFAKNVLGE